MGSEVQEVYVLITYLESGKESCTYHVRVIAFPGFAGDVDTYCGVQVAECTAHVVFHEWHQCTH